jgi:NitT/TauT family transport system permease protein
VLARSPRAAVIVAPLVLLILVLVGWEAVVRLAHVNRIILPAPTEIIRAMGTDASLLLRETGVTMAEAVLGFVLGSGIAYALAIMFIYSTVLRTAIYPFAVGLKSTPLIALAPVLVLWFGNGMASKVVMAALVAFFPVLVNAVVGLNAIDPEAFDLMKSLSASRLQVLTKIRIPTSLPYVFAGLRVSSSLAVVGAVIGEFTGSIRGIGHVITTSSYYLDTDVMFAAVIMISLAGIALFAAIAYLDDRFVFWNKH